ncbi:MAG: hypothetical protein RLZZ111_65 [Planctomycetota bacterium]
MILKSIRLHPFGGTTDRARGLEREVAVYLGPNEAGKSTLRQAIHHALFTPTNLTPKATTAAVGRWYPRPDGDHAVVTLVFEHDGCEWALTKRWGAGAATQLASADGTTIGEPATVQQKLADFLGFNEATSALVLSTGQAELSRTVDLLGKADPQKLPPVADLLQAAAGAAGDVGPERLRSALEQKIKDFFGRWERTTGRPALDGGRERGVKDPWLKLAGSIVKAWYAWQEKVEEHKELLEQERQLHKVSSELADLEAQVAADNAFLTTGGPLRAGLGRRKLVELSLGQAREAAKPLAAIAGKWPTAAAEVAVARQTLNRLETQKKQLDVERETARQRAEATRTQTEYDAILAARTAWLEAEQAVQKSFRPPLEAAAELEQVVERIRQARNRIDAQKLAYEIAATQACSMRIAEGTEPPREVAVEGGACGIAKSRLRIEAGPVSVTVTSGEEDVEPMFRGLERDLARETELLAICRAASLVDVKAESKRHDGLVVEAAARKNTSESRLRDRTFEEWQQAVEAIAKLPQTRDLAAVTAELGRLENEIKTEQQKAAVNDANIREWVEKYGDQGSLLELIVKNRTQVAEAEAELKGLPDTPEGFATADEFLWELERRETENRERPAKVRELAATQQQLRDAVGERSAADLAEEAEARRRAFEAKLSEGRAYERILAALQEVVQERKVDPMAGFAATVTEMFRAITGGVDQLEFQGQLPSRVVRGPVLLDADMLSHGAGTALALALRLALADAHLGGRTGFIVLDDPFVELDADRRERAKAVVRRFAARHQVIFLTCHEPHAAGWDGKSDG